ncbi:MAG: diguanylate cyclase [Treponema sp.]|nr:diguanylate cyclase [Treponema sp.]
MQIDLTAFTHIANSLSKHFDSLYYVEIDTGKYIEFIRPKLVPEWDIPKEGDSFFFKASKNACKFVHPDDLQNVFKFLDKAAVLRNLAKNDTCSLTCRLVIDGKVVYVRHVNIMCEDRKHVLCCMENIDEEVRQKSEQERNLQSAEQMARRDELTGIKNKNAFAEYSQAIDGTINSGAHDFKFAVLVCDMNDLKVINDTRGHSFGDEALQRTSRMICDAFKHSPVFRIGGDEFAAVLTDYDYELRDELLAQLREESEKNGRTRSGPQVASGLAAYDPSLDSSFDDVFGRADGEMYKNKKLMKSLKSAEGGKKFNGSESPITEERKRKLDSLFGALYTIAGGGYVFLNDMRYDYSRWSLPLVNDFGIKSEYMYHADKVWDNYIHPDDEKKYKEVVAAALHENSEFIPMCYRARKTDGTYVPLTTRAFILNDADGNPDYFGGIIVPQ